MAQQSARASLGRIVDDGIAQLFPGYFALVMATGIVSIACALLNIPVLPDALFGLNVVAYAVLWALTGVRVARHSPKMIADLAHHGRSPGFFTTVAGTCILGTQCLVLYGERAPAEVLWWLGIALWVGVIYAFFTVLSIREIKPELGAGINGAWLIAIVATQSISILGALLAVDMAAGEARELQLFFCLCMFLLGCFLYLPFISMIMYRFAFYKLPPSQLTPPYWINMGAVAITTLAGSILLLIADSWPFLEALRPFLLGFTLFFWSAATWWIPLLVILGIWRHGVARFPLSYDPQYWGLVFPMGMYTVCTWRLAEASDLAFLKAIPRVWIYVAIATWSLTFIGLVGRLFALARDRPMPGAD